MKQRFKTRQVQVGTIGIGGNNPIRIQSMTNTPTMDTRATAAQCIRLFEAGCEMVRIAAPGIKEAKNLGEIKLEIERQGYRIPLIADIHYKPKAAEEAAAIVEKVRINPGNYTDRNWGKVNFTEAEYNASLDKIRENILPLIRICKKHGTALRIGSNHGSLSDRIVDRYGDTPLGMVEAALEFAGICRDEDFHQIVFSMKSSNVRVMLHATRLLVKRMMDEGMDYPVHLGVTEAGNGTEGRIKSAAGIGALLSDGIGDTIRVSLTEDPVLEIPVAKKIIATVNTTSEAENRDIFDRFFYPPFIHQQRPSDHSHFEPSQKPPLVISLPGNFGKEKPDIITGTDGALPPEWQFLNLNSGTNPSLTGTLPMVAESTASPAIFTFRKLFYQLHQTGSESPVILSKKYYSQGDDLALEAAIDFGSLFLDGFGDGIWLKAKKESAANLVELAFTILQATGARITKTEYIACPSCGRTQFNIQDALQKIKAVTAHLTGLKIAVMGCIVNGPGEMADANYGYVGMGSGKVALYKGRQLMQKSIDESHALQALISLIREHGDWKNP
jgi:(E)-4-hydroxy-3-methylbut-2-enyl-diphosphate synthase